MSQHQDTVAGSTISYEQQLWKKFQQGDQPALASIYSTYFDQLYNYGSRFTRDQLLVEDTIQELFIKLIRNRQNLAVPDSLKSYLFKALRSALFDKLEASKKYMPGDINDTVGFELVPHAEAIIVGNEEAAAQNEKLANAFLQLTPRQREAIFLKYQEGLSYPEIADLLSLSQKATYKLIGRAIQALRSICISAIVFSQLLAFHNV